MAGEMTEVADLVASLRGDPEAARMVMAGRALGAASGALGGYLVMPRRWSILGVLGGGAVGGLVGGALGGVAAAASNPVGAAAGLLLGGA